MAPVTKIIQATLAPNATPSPIQTAFTTIKSTPGSQSVRAAHLISNPTQLRFFVDWDALTSHTTFLASPAFQSFISVIAPHVAGKATVLHVEFTPHPPAVLDNDGGKGRTAVALVLFAYFTPEDDYAINERNLGAAERLVDGIKDAVLNGFSGETAVGWSVERDVEYKGEGTRVLVVVLGWDSVEAHREAKGTDIYGRLVDEFEGKVKGLRGFDVEYVTTEAL